jgi:hypothetical protein
MILSVRTLTSRSTPMAIGTGRPLANDAKYPILLTSRSGVVDKTHRGIRFDWHDKATRENPYKADPAIDRVYLVGAEAIDIRSVIFPWCIVPIQWRSTDLSEATHIEILVQNVKNIN